MKQKRINPSGFAIFALLLTLFIHPQVSWGLYDRQPTDEEIKKMNREELQAYIEQKKKQDPLVAISQNTPYLQKEIAEGKGTTSPLIQTLKTSQPVSEEEYRFTGYRLRRNWRGKPTQDFDKEAECSLWVSGKKWKITLMGSGTKPVTLELGEKPHYFELTFLSKDGKTLKGFWGVPENSYFKDAVDDCTGFLNPGESCSASERFSEAILMELFRSKNIKQIDILCYGEDFRLLPKT